MLSLRESGASCYTSATMTARPVVMIACICLLLAVFLSPAAAQETGSIPGTYRATIAGHKVLLPSVAFDGVPFVSARALAAALGGKATPGKRPGDLTLDLSGHGLAFSADDLSLVRLESGATSMLTEARPIGGDLYVPTEFIARVIAPLLEERPPAEGGRLDLQVIGGEGTLRLAFQCPRPIRHELKDEGGVLLLVMSGPSMLPPFQTRWLGSTLVREISFETRPGALVARMEKGEGYLSASATSVRDPGGVVVDVRGSASVQRRAPTGGLAMAGELGPVTASEPPPSAALAPAAHAGRRQLEKLVVHPDAHTPAAQFIEKHTPELGSQDVRVQIGRHLVDARCGQAFDVGSDRGGRARHDGRAPGKKFLRPAAAAAEWAIETASSADA